MTLKALNHRDRRLLDLARGQRCQNCGAHDGTVVAAHSNCQEHGKGKSIKAHDCLHAWLCFACHAWLDGQASGYDPSGCFDATRSDRRAMFERAFARTVVELWRRGLVRVT